MRAVAVFGITNDGLNLAVNLLLLFLAVLWLALVYWTLADARRRIGDPLLVGCATAASLFPFVGTLVYLIVRPPEYLDDVRERELEIAAAEARLARLEDLACPYCSFEIEGSFLRCPSCLRRLKEPCATCSKPLDPRWKICPYCEAEIGQAAPQRRARRVPAGGGATVAAAGPTGGSGARAPARPTGGRAAAGASGAEAAAGPTGARAPAGATGARAPAGATGARAAAGPTGARAAGAPRPPAVAATATEQRARQVRPADGAGPDDGAPAHGDGAGHGDKQAVARSRPPAPPA